MEPLQYCYICLSTNVKLYNENQHNLALLYSDTVKSPTIRNSYKYFCFECTSILHKYENFKIKCLRSQEILKQIYETNNLVTTNIISEAQNINNLHNLSISSTIDAVEIKYDPEKSQDIAIKIEQTSTEVQNSIQREINSSADTKDDIKINLLDTDNHDNETWDSDDYLTLQAATKSKKPKVRLKKVENTQKAASKTKKKAKIKIVSKNTSSQEGKVKFLQQRSRALKMDTSKWKIVNLSEDEALKEFTKVTETENYKNSMFHCDLCLKIFLTEDTLTRHMKVHNEAQGDHECQLCKKRFTFSSRLRKHMQDHTVRYHCLRCPAVIPNKNTALLHNKFHDGVVYTCKICSATFAKSSTYYTHVRETHRSRHVCARCGVSFVSQWGVNLHAKHKHRDEVSESAEQAEESVPPADDTYCAKCDITFTTVEAFIEHKGNSALHLDDDSASNPTLLKSRRAAQPRPPRARYVCEVCGARVALKYISQHRQIHARLQQPCATCGKVFTSAKQQAIHTYKHTGVKPLACRVCARRFVLEHVLRGHMRRRHAEPA